MLIGHGGTQDKRADYVLALARMLARHHGIASFAIDAPGHGERADTPMSVETFDVIWSRPGVDDELLAVGKTLVLRANKRTNDPVQYKHDAD